MPGRIRGRVRARVCGAWYDYRIFIIQPTWTRVANAPWTGVSGKEDKHEMAKTIRKTEPTTAEEKPAARRAKAAPPAAGAGKVTTRRQAKTAAGAANAQQPSEQGFASEPTHDEIALRAWSIYENRGGGHGQAFEDGVEARKQLFLERGLKP